MAKRNASLLWIFYPKENWFVSNENLDSILSMFHWNFFQLFEYSSKVKKYIFFQFFSENAPCVAFLNKEWHRGIVLETVSATDEYTILCADTLKSLKVHRDLVQVCPPDLLNTKLDYIKVRFSKMMPHPRIRPQDLSKELSKALLNKNLCLFAKIVGVSNDAVPEIKLYYDEKCIYPDWIEQRWYKNI